MEKATFAAGCFWGVEDAFSKIKGVTNTIVGYMGGTLENPSYLDVCTNKTGHAEVVQIEFDPSVVSYKEMLSIFWKIHDPTTLNRQGPDVGTQYRSAIFYHTEEQRLEAEEYKTKLEAAGCYGGRPIVTEIVPASIFWRAEEYHQHYFEKRGGGACHIAPNA